MIDDNSLTQVFATVLTGVLIFLTFERRIDFKEIRDTFGEAYRKKKSLQEDLDILTNEMKGLRNKMKEEDTAPSDDTLHKQKLAAFDKRIEEIEAERSIKTKKLLYIEKELSRMLMISVSWYRQYTDLETLEGITTLSMIIILSGSVLVMILASTAMDYMPPVIQQSYDFISSVIFSIGIILLIIRVHLHGKVTLPMA